MTSAVPKLRTCPLYEEGVQDNSDSRELSHSNSYIRGARECSQWSGHSPDISFFLNLNARGEK